jgi:uncharacterized protein (TIRG00374 family)
LVKKIFFKLKKFLPFIGIILLFYTIHTLDFSKIIDSFLLIKPIFIVISLLLTFPRVFIRNYVWRIIQKEHNIKLSYFQSLKIFLIGYFYGSFTPGYMGQLMRVPYMKEKTGEPYGKLFVNSLIETIVHSISLFAMIFIGALLVLSIFPELFIITITWLIIMIIILIYFLKKDRGEKLFYFLIKYLIPYKLKNSFYKFVDTFYKDFPKIKGLIIPVVLGIITWVIIFSQEYIFVIALDLDIPYLYFLLLFPVANVVGFIPITFAGLGTRELTAVILFSTLFLVPEADIFVVSLLGFVITDVFTGFIGFILSLSETKIIINYS